MTIVTDVEVCFLLTIIKIRNLQKMLHLNCYIKNLTDMILQFYSILSAQYQIDHYLCILNTRIGIPFSMESYSCLPNLLPIAHCEVLFQQFSKLKSLFTVACNPVSQSIVVEFYFD